MEMQSLGFAQLGLGLALAQYPSLWHFGMYILCHDMLEVCDLLFDFIEITVKRLHKCQKRQNY